MKKNITVLWMLAALVMSSGIAAAQSANDDGSNIVKINLAALAFKNFSFQYERKAGEASTFALGVRYRPEGSIPFKKAAADLVDDPSIRVDLAKIGNLGITPEYRFYFGNKGAFHGLYIGGFLSYNHYSGDVPINYNDYDDVNHVSIERTALFSGSTNAFTAGIQLGAQWKLGDKIYLDWWILGPNYGFSKGDFNFSGTLNDIEQISMRFELEKIQQTIPLVEIEIPRLPDASGAVFRVKGPWAGIRAFGLNLGYRF